MWDRFKNHRGKNLLETWDPPWPYHEEMKTTKLGEDLRE